MPGPGYRGLDRTGQDEGVKSPQASPPVSEAVKPSSEDFMKNSLEQSEKLL